MDINHLEDDELTFELALRGVRPNLIVHRSVKLKNLKTILDKEAKEKNIPTSSTNVMSDVDNIYNCQAKISPIVHLVETAIRQKLYSDLKKYRSRLLHYRFRLTLITDSMITANANKTISKLEAALTRIEDCLQQQQQPANVGGRPGDQDILPTEKETLDRLKHSNLQSSIKEVVQQHVLLGQQHNNDRAEQQRNLVLQDQQEREQQGNLPQQREQQELIQQQFQQLQEPQQWDRQPWTQQQQPTTPAPLNSSQHPLQADQTLHAQFQNLIRQQQEQIQQFAQLQVQYGQLQQSLEEEKQRRFQLEHEISIQRQGTYQNYYAHDAVRREPFEPYANGLTSPLNAHAAQQSRTAENGHPSRFSQPLHRWKIEEYGGENNIQKLGEFLNQIKMYAETEGMDDTTRLRSVKQLLKGRAFEWYTRTYRYIHTWEAFKLEIKKEFLPPYYSEIFKQDLYLRFQGANESFTSFYRDLLSIFEIIEPPMPESEKLFIIKSHLNTEFVPIAAASQVTTVQQLVKVCKDFEVSRSYAMKNRPSAMYRPPWNKPFQPQNTRITGNNSPAQQLPYRNIGRQQVNMLENNVIEQESELEREEYQERELTQLETAMNAEEEMLTITENINALHLRQGPFNRNPRYSEDSTNTNGQKTKITLTCWQCETPGHTYLMCQNPRTFVFCFTCGRKGCTTRNCQSCQARWRQLAPENQQSFSGNGKRESL
ncbi:defective chorion protein, FC106 isoform-like [Uranotaenia lowii]|uniref:defective chorion protein, FC106 isoform-like n=1 Tax=Uranotaenia lowii TaxID=190385 RepID=UPI00247A272C|nr:defective chorion protein, FC106 isoform-like [Uranotaenia lowii]